MIPSAVEHKLLVGDRVKVFSSFGKVLHAAVYILIGKRSLDFNISI